MKRPKGFTYVALLVPLAALVLAGAVIAGGGSNSDINENNDPPGGGDECICPQIYDPVICTQPSSGTIISTNTAKKFSNACFAGCEGYTECRPAPDEVRP